MDNEQLDSMARLSDWKPAQRDRTARRRHQHGRPGASARVGWRALRRIRTGEASR